MGDRPDYTGSVVIEGTVTVSGTVSIFGTVTITGNVNITNTSIIVEGKAGGTAVAITGSVVIENIVAGTVNVQTTAGVEVGIGKFETTPVGRLIKNDAGTGQWLQSIATDKYGKFFPNSMRGQLHNVPIYVKNATASPVNLVLKYAVRPLMPDQFSTSRSIPASSEGWVNVAVAKYWDYDSLFVYAENATLSIGMDTPASDNDADCFAYISGAWQWLGYRPWIRATLKVQTHYAVTVDGQVSVKDIDDYTEVSPEYFIKKGKAFNVRGVVMNLGPGARAYPLIIYNPSNSGKTAYVFAVIGRSTAHPIIVDILRITGYSGGTALTPVNLRFGDPTTSSMTCVQNPSSTPGGDIIATGASATGVELRSIYPMIVLPPNTYVQFDVYNLHTTTDNLVVHAHWYEV